MLTRTWPAATSLGTQQANALYQVLDSVPRGPDWQPGRPPVYLQTMLAADRQEFTNIDRQSNAQFNATFVAITGTGTDVRYNTGVRIRGSASRNDPVPANRIRIPSDRDWMGLTRLNINARNPVAQVAGSAMFRLAGLPASDVHAVTMLSNGVDFTGGSFYVHAEPLDSQFAANHFPHDPEGNIYRGRRPDESPPGGRGAGLVYFGEDPAPYVSYVKNTNASQADWSDVIELTRILNRSPNETYVQDVQRVADVDEWFRAFAVNAMIDNNENGLFTGDRQGDDFAMYRGLIDTRFDMIPYDWDSPFGRVDRSIFRPTSVPALDRLINHPEFLPRYYGQFVDLIDNVLLTDTADTVLDEALGAITTENRINSIKTFLRDRAAFVRSQIPSELTVDTGLSRQNGMLHTTEPIIRLSGTSPVVQTRSVLVNGVLVPSLDGRGNWSLDATTGPTVTLLPAGSIWKYSDTGDDLGAAWRDANFDDSSWAQGPAQLGYGDGDESTVISFGGDPNNKFPTAYFRSRFTVDDPSQFDSLTLRLVHDDGAAVYVNGTEVVRTNLPANATYSTLADGFRSGNVENEFDTFIVPVSILVPGENVVAVEVHQASVSSSDVSFDMELLGSQLVDAGSSLRLTPGLNRIVVQAFSQPEGMGEEVASVQLDVWYDQPGNAITQDIVANTTWTADEGPYQVAGRVNVASGATLRIEAGTSVFFDDNASLRVNGRLLAAGEPFHEVRFTRTPGGTSWNGIQFVGSMNDSQIDHAILEYGRTDNGMIGLENSELLVTNSVFDQTDLRRIRSIDSSLIVRQSTFTNIADPNEAPATNNRSEHIWGRGIPQNGQWILEDNTFGHVTGHNDAIDFDAPSLPNPIPRILNNRFVGGGDDALDMTGDVYIEGNTFTNFIKDRFNTDPGESNTISASGGQFWVIRNVFDNVQHASLIKEDAMMYFLNDTVVNSSRPPLYFDLPGQTSGPGKGAIVEGSLFANVAVVFDQVQPTTDLQVRNSFLPEGTAVPGVDLEGNGNLFGDPHVLSAADDYQLGRGSQARGNGPNGQDMGAKVPAGASISGVPEPRTARTQATLQVGGPAIVGYRYRVNQGPWSDELSVTVPILLTDLADGPYQVDVIGKNFLDIWQPDDQPTSSPSWIVDRNLPPQVRINEIQAVNQSTLSLFGRTPDWMELYNPGPMDVSLSGMILTDSLERPDKFRFPAGTMIPAQSYLLVTLGGEDAPGLLNAHFQLDQLGDELYLTDANGTVISSVTFGRQIPDLSIGVVDREGNWDLTQPTPGQANLTKPVDGPEALKLNEWLASADVRLKNDFLEIYNPQSRPAPLGGLTLTDEPPSIPDMYAFAPLSFIPNEGFATYIADGKPENGPDHVNFRLAAFHEHLALNDQDGSPIDQVFYYPQTSEYSQGRSPDGDSAYEFFRLPTPGLPNESIRSQTRTVAQLDWDSRWRYQASGADQGTAWRDPNFDDSLWLSGRGPLGNENETLPVPIRTSFPLGGITYYFRTDFTLDVDPTNVVATFNTLIDDGVIVYVNGQEALRLGMPEGNVPFDQTASRNVNEAQIEGPFTIASDLLVRGRNVIAAEVHQTRRNSSDLVFGIEMEATATELDPQDQNLIGLLDGLRVTELMYNPAEGGTEFIEVANVGDMPLDLTGVQLNGGVEFLFPDVRLAPGERAVVADQPDLYLQQYGSGSHLVGQFTGALSNQGERIILRLPDPQQSAILRFDYDALALSFPETNGTGRSLEIVDPNRFFTLWSDPSSWQPSQQIEGTPGYQSGQTPVDDGLRINEVLSHTDPPLVDSVEIINISSLPVDLSGWYLSDSTNNFRKYAFPAGTLLAAGDYLIVDESDFNPTMGASPTDFALDGAHGDQLWLWRPADGGLLRHVSDFVEFGAARNGESFGRFPDGDGPLVPMSSRTFGAPNAAPRVGPVILSEVHYHPADPSPAAKQIEPTITDNDLEFIEIANTSAQAESLRDWKLAGGIDFDFPTDAILPAGATLVVVSFDPATPANATRLAAFRQEFGMTPGVQIIGPYRGRIDNGGERIQLLRPDEPPADEPNFIPMMLEDEIAYDDAAPWPVTADGGGDALNRVLPANWGSFVGSWTAAPPNPGSVRGLNVPGDLTGDGQVDVADVDALCTSLRSNDANGDLNADGRTDQGDLRMLIVDILGTTFGDANLDGRFDSADLLLVFQAGQYEDNVPGNSTWQEGDWNCDGDFTTKDLVFAFQSGGYIAAATPTTTSHNAFVDDAMVRDIATNS